MPAVFTAADARHWALLTRAALAARRTEIDALNVFPVPDGDTGSNLSSTLGHVLQGALSRRSRHIGELLVRIGNDAIDVRLRRLAVEVDAEDVPPGLRERDRAGLAETGRGTENEGPPRLRIAGQSGADVVKAADARLYDAKRARPGA